MKNLLAAFMFFTRLPLWRIVKVPDSAFKHVVHYWPWVGLLTGGVAAGVMLLAGQVFPAYLAVILGLASRLLLTGCLHEDGLADFFDGFGGGVSRDRILAIMKDSHIGTYGVVGLILYFLLAVAALSSVPLVQAAAFVICGDVFCKFIGSQIVNVLPYARPQEECKIKVIYDRIPLGNQLANIILAAVAMSCIHPDYYPAAVAPIVVFVLLMILYKKKIGGYTGDCCGAAFLLCELSFYLALAALAGIPA